MRQEEKVAVSRNKIIGTSIRIFGQKGFRASSTNEICQASDISKGLLFYYFNTKEQLFQDCAKQCINEFDHFMQDNFIKNLAPLEDIRTCCLLRKEFFMEHPYHHRIFGEILYNNNYENRQKNQALIDQYERHSYDIISRILEDLPLNPRISRNESIRWAVTLIQFIDTEIWNKYQSDEKTEEMLEAQMKHYESFLEVLLYGILEK